MELAKEIQSEITHFLSVYGRAPSHNSTSELDLDSFTTVHLISLLEKRFSVRFEVSDIIFDNFSTIEKITSLVAKKVG